MASVTYDHVTKRFGEVVAVNDLDIEIEDKEFLVLVGPSGCGKTTALRLLAGLEEITQVETLEEAVMAAARVARSGDVVLLSPGGTSFDAFRDFAERGDRFKELVHAL